MQQIVGRVMTPKLASAAVLQKFQATIKPDTLRIAAKKYASAEAVQGPAKKGKQCILPREVEEGLVEIVELLQSSSPPFPVFKSS